MVGTATSPGGFVASPSAAYIVSVDPSAGGSAHRHAPSHPRTMTMYDEELGRRPLEEFNDVEFSMYYPSGCPAPVSSCPPDSRAPYLLPTFTKNEVERLTSLWYYTQHIETDAELLSRLQLVVDTVQDVMQRDCTVLGLMDHDRYTSITTSNVPLATLSRQETVCAHTIMQPSGTVFMLPDMSDDWRFAKSPHIVAGLRYYAGTQLHFRVPGSDTDVAIGTLCVVAHSAQPPLTPVQSASLTRLADTITHMILERARVQRMSTHEKMTARLHAVLPTLTLANVVSRVLGVLRAAFPSCTVSHQIQLQDVVRLRGPIAVPYADFLESGLWEATELVHDLILRKQQEEPQMTPQALRAIAVRLRSFSHAFIVLETDDLKMIFDDIDVAFVAACATTICNVLLGGQLEATLAAKTHLLRGVSHELRTPIHAVVASAELLLDEARSGTAARDKIVPMLGAVREAGENLRTFVDRLVHYDTLSGVEARGVRRAMHPLAAIEREVLRAAPPCAAIIAENVLPLDGELLLTDADLLREALGALLRCAAVAADTVAAAADVVNVTAEALASASDDTDTTDTDTTAVDTDAELDTVATAVETAPSAPRVMIILRISLSPDRSALDFDVMDVTATTSGPSSPQNSTAFPVGIAAVLLPDLSVIPPPLPGEDTKTEKQRIIASALELSIASRIAAELGGSAVLVSAVNGRGAHYRLRLNDPAIVAADMTAKPSSRSSMSSYWPLLGHAGFPDFSSTPGPLTPPLADDEHLEQTSMRGRSGSSRSSPVCRAFSPSAGELNLRQDDQNVLADAPSIHGDSPRTFFRVRRGKVPLTYHTTSPSDGLPIHMTLQLDAARRHLDALGFACVEEDSAALLLVADTPSVDLPAWQIAVVIVDSNGSDSPSDDATGKHVLTGDRVVSCYTPISRFRLLAALDVALKRYCALNLRAHRPGGPTPSPTMSTPRMPFLGAPAVTVSGTPQRRTLSWPPRILIVDDNIINVNILVMYAKKRRYVHAIARDGIEAVDTYASALEGGAHPGRDDEGGDDTVDGGGVERAGAAFTLVLMDLQMPRLDGAGATRRIRDLEAEHGILPSFVYMVSGQSMAKDKAHALEMGADGYFVKPFGIRALDELIKTHFIRG
ncbi:hypothetical protein FISHEDRAFT_59391 [Fistulina hepatica ATCC 64428]|uniref:histidine kinase n=1 Tax=Fistulina hepatica ATCC 64428 TaxID=1128425 RepID=A0A0D7A9V2_9AGAR|nr:hypothetical protein FISHEDRAFT_59391 [Fistulina hepatica ATCC 64428]